MNIVINTITGDVQIDGKHMEHLSPIITYDHECIRVEVRGIPNKKNESHLNKCFLPIDKLSDTLRSYILDIKGIE